MPNFPELVGEWLIDLLSFIGLGLGGSQAAAAGIIEELQQNALHDAASGHVFFDIPARGRTHTPAALAEMVVKAVLPFDDAAEEAKFSGVQRGRFDDLVKMTGNPPGFGTLLAMWRRRIIQPSDVEIGIRQGYMKAEWIPYLTQLHDELLPVHEAVNAAVQNHLPYLDAEDIAWKQGVTGADFTTMFQNAGNPPGPMELLDLWRRGDIDEATVDQGLRESRLKDKYIDALKKRAIHLVPMRTITTLLTHGAITDERALTMLRQLGFRPEDAQAIVTASHFQKAAPAKELSLTAVKTLYTDHMIDRASAVADIVKIGYNDAAANQILDLADHEISTRDRRATITKIRNAYLTRRIDRANASGDLDVIGVEAGQRDQLLRLWDIELDNNVAVLTPAQIVHAGKLTIFTQDETVARLEAHGYSAADAIILAMIGGAIPIPPTTQPGG